MSPIQVDVSALPTRIVSPRRASTDGSERLRTSPLCYPKSSFDATDLDWVTPDAVTQLLLVVKPILEGFGSLPSHSLSSAVLMTETPSS
jgi:hypothetical protein